MTGSIRREDRRRRLSEGRCRLPQLTRQDEVRYTASQGLWTIPLASHTAAPTYANKVNLNSSTGNYLAEGCALSTLLPFEGEERTLPDGSVHVSKTSVRVGQTLSFDQYQIATFECFAGVVKSESDPGAIELSWSGGVYKGSFNLLRVDTDTIGRAIADDDLESLFTGPTGIAEVRPPSRTAERTIPGYTCTSPCQGGIATSRFIAVPPAYLSNDQYYIIGTHTYSRGGHEWTDEIEVIWQAKAPRLRAVAAILEAVITELAGRINETQEQEIRDAFDEAGGS